MVKDKKSIMEFIKRDVLYIIVCLFALGACIYTITSVEKYQEQCNIYCESYISTCNCFCNDDGYIPFNESFKLYKPYTEQNGNNT